MDITRLVLPQEPHLPHFPKPLPRLSTTIPPPLSLPLPRLPSPHTLHQSPVLPPSTSLPPLVSPVSHPPSPPPKSLSPTITPTTHRVECGLCGKSFSGISSHNRHVSRTHHNARPFACASCGLQFGQKGSLDRHTAAVHLKSRPFECSFCRKGFGRKDNMKIHMTTVHLKKKPFKCDMCPKSFGGKRPLKIHRQTVHFKERPLRCQVCDKRFGQRSNLNVHVKVHRRAASAQVLPTSPIGSVEDLGSVQLEQPSVHDVPARILPPTIPAISVVTTATSFSPLTTPRRPLSDHYAASPYSAHPTPAPLGSPI